MLLNLYFSNTQHTQVKDLAELREQSVTSILSVVQARHTRRNADLSSPNIGEDASRRSRRTSLHADASRRSSRPRIYLGTLKVLLPLSLY
jgi:hypothetical protein